MKRTNYKLTLIGAFCSHKRMRYACCQNCKDAGRSACLVECPDCGFTWMFNEGING